MTAAYVALGSNLGDSYKLLHEAMVALDALPSTAVVAQSRLYRTPPWGVLDQPDFLNAVVRLETSLSPYDLLDALLSIEAAAGRVREGERWGPRTLDLDLLHMDGIRLDQGRLILPHPRMAERAFVLLPLSELAPELLLPDGSTVRRQLERIDHDDCVVVS